MTAGKPGPGPGPGPGEIVQRYRFRVRTADGRELVSQVATVTRPLPPSPAKISPAERAAELTRIAPGPPTKFTDVPVHHILVAIVGKTQGELHAAPGLKDVAGTVPKHQLSTEEFEFSTISPRDPQSGLPTGQRMHKPVVFTVALSPASPQLYAALAANEVLPTVVFDCYGQTTAGTTALAHSVKLTNASVASIELRMPNLRDPILARYDERQLIALTFEKIELSNGAAVAGDSWEPNR